MSISAPSVANNAPQDTLSREHVALATAALRTYTAEVPVDLAVVTGSIAFGLEHQMSDVDVYVVPREGVGGRPTIPVADRTVQINALSRERFEELCDFATLRSQPLSARNRAYIVSDGVCKDAIRMARGRVLEVEPGLGAALASFDWEVLARRVMSREAIQASQFLEDVAGAVESQDWDTATLAGRIAVGHAAEAVLASIRDLYSGPKFLARRLRRSLPHGPLVAQLLSALDVPDTDNSFTLPDAVDYELMRRALVERAGLAAYAVATAHLLGWHGPPERLPAYSSGTAGPRRSPWFTTFRFDDGLGLAGLDRGFRLSEQTARLWYGMTGQSTAAELGEATAAAERLADLGVVWTTGRR